MTKTICWTELHAADPAAAAEFYGALMGWTFRDTETPHGTYRDVCLEPGPGAGLRHADPALPGGWMMYVQVDELEAELGRAVELGASVQTPITPIPDGGRYAVLRDPGGNVFGMVQER